MQNEPEMPTLPASVKTAALVAGQLLHFDEHVDVVVERLETARVGGQPAELTADHRKVVVSPQAAGAWVTAWQVNPTIQRAPAGAEHVLRSRVAG